MTDVNPEVAKSARAIRSEAEDKLDTLARSIQRDSETFEKAYARALGTEGGLNLLQIRDDAQQLECGGVTSAQIAKVGQELARGEDA